MTASGRARRVRSRPARCGRPRARRLFVEPGSSSSISLARCSSVGALLAERGVRQQIERAVDGRGNDAEISPPSSAGGAGGGGAGGGGRRASSMMRTAGRWAPAPGQARGRGDDVGRGVDGGEGRRRVLRRRRAPARPWPRSRSSTSDARRLRPGYQGWRAAPFDRRPGYWRHGRRRRCRRKPGRARWRGGGRLSRFQPPYWRHRRQ